MARQSKRIAMYEVIGQASLKSAQDKVLKRASDTDQQSPKDEIVTAEPALPRKPSGNWPSKPGPVRFYRDRIEVCFSWQVAIIGVLALLAMFLVFFRLGRLQRSVESTAPPAAKREITPIKPVLRNRKVQRSLEPVVSPRLVEPMGDNVIVISSYHIKSHLEPVREYFKRFGIETEIVKAGNRYLLVTKSRFDNSEKVGTDGNEMKKRIIAIGANYSPPSGSGFESFGTKPFSDAYGMKIN